MCYCILDKKVQEGNNFVNRPSFSSSFIFLLFLGMKKNDYLVPAAADEGSEKRPSARSSQEALHTLALTHQHLRLITTQPTLLLKASIFQR
jgi:hypothetical protein